MRSWLVVMPVVLLACGRGEGSARLGPRFAEVARIDDTRGPSTNLAAALRAWDEIDGEVSELRRSLPKGAPLPLADAPEGLARAMAALIAAHEAGERLPPDDCFGSILDLAGLGNAAIESAPAGDSRQLEAAAWLGARIREDRTSLIGAVVGLTLTRDAIVRLAERGLPIGEAARAARPPDDVVARSFAREALCSARMMDQTQAKAGGDDELARGLIDGERAALVALQEETLTAVVAAPSPDEAIAAITRAGEEANASSSELVRAMFGGLGYADLEAIRAAISERLATPSPAAPAPAPPSSREVPRAGDGSLASELGALVLVPEPRGVRLLNVTPEHPWYAWGARHGDLLQKVDDGVVTSPGDAATRLGALAVGAHRLALARGDREVVLPFTVSDPDAPIVIPRARVADAAALRRELESSGLTLAWDADARAFVVGGVGTGALPALLGLRDGDRLVSIGTHFAYEAHDAGQSGHAFLVDGLEGRTVGATVGRGEARLRLTWTFE